MTKMNGRRCTIAGSRDGRKKPLTPGGRKEMGSSLEPPGRNAVRLASDFQN